jgi:hypothetical protein
MEVLLGMDLAGSERALRALASSVVHRGRHAAAAAAAPFLIELLDRGEHPTEPEALLGLLARIASGDPDVVACGGEVAYGGALEATPDEIQAEREVRQRCHDAVAAGRDTVLRWLIANDARARGAAAQVLAFVAVGDGGIDEALAGRARDEDEHDAVRASALFALGLRGAACASDLPPMRAQDVGEATLLEAAAIFAALGAKDAVLLKAAERTAVDILARGVSPDPLQACSPWPPAERLLLGRLARNKGRSARAQSALLRLLPLTRDRARAERIASALLVLSFGEPTAAAFSDWRPTLESFPGASAWSAEQRGVLRTIAGHDILWPESAEEGPRVRHVDACTVQVELKRMLELAYYPSRKGLRTAIALAFTAGAGGARR